MVKCVGRSFSATAYKVSTPGSSRTDALTSSLRADRYASRCDGSTTSFDKSYHPWFLLSIRTARACDRHDNPRQHRKNRPLSGTGREIQLAQKRLIARVVGKSAPQRV